MNANATWVLGHIGKQMPCCDARIHGLLNINGELVVVMFRSYIATQLRQPADNTTSEQRHGTSNDNNSCVLILNA